MNIYCEKLTKCFNDEVVGKGCFPDSLKQAEVTPVFKDKGNSNDKLNYRPISCVSPLANVFEKLVSKQLSSYLRIFFLQFYLVLERVTTLKVLYFVCLKFGINI